MSATSWRFDDRNDLHAEVERWRAVNDSLPDTVVHLDQDGRVVYANRWLPTSALGTFLPDLVPDEADRSRLAVLVHLVLQGDDGDGFEYVDPRVNAIVALPGGGAAFEYADPTGPVYECRAAPIRSGGQIVGAVLVVRDVTEQRRTQRDLQAAITQLAQSQKLSAIGQLAAGMAHEINTPVQFVSDNVVFLERSFERLLRLLDVVADVAREHPRLEAAVAEARLAPIREHVPRAIAQSREGLNRVAKIVGAMTDFSHPSHGSKERIALREAFETTATIARNEWKYVAELEIDTPDDLPPVALLRDEFNQVLLNLVVNASHAVAERFAEGELLGRITLAARSHGESVEIRVSDNGCGIPEAIRERVFEPFFTTKPVGKGTGQGLAIAWSVIVEKHGGTIALESEVGAGTTFVIFLPTHPTQAGAAIREVRPTRAVPNQ